MLAQVGSLGVSGRGGGAGGSTLIFECQHCELTVNIQPVLRFHFPFYLANIVDPRVCSGLCCVNRPPAPRLPRPTSATTLRSEVKHFTTRFVLLPRVKRTKRLALKGQNGFFRLVFRFCFRTRFFHGLAVCTRCGGRSGMHIPFSNAKNKHHKRSFVVGRKTGNGEPNSDRPYWPH